MLNREDFKLAWKRRDLDQIGTIEPSDLHNHTTRLASFMGSPGLEEPSLPCEPALSLYDGLANPTEGTTNRLDKE